MVNLYLDNVYIKIKGMEYDDEIKLWNVLSFQVQVFGMQEIHYRHLYNRKTKKAYAGLTPYIINFLNKEEIDFELHDNRVIPEQNGNFKLVDYLDEEKKIKLEVRPYQQQLVDNCGSRSIIQAATGAGKAVTLDTPILTPNGFVEMRNIHIGDIVYDETGKQTTVIAEYPQGKLQVYEITFSDGTVIKCCKDHLWKYNTKFGRINNDDYKTNTTQYLVDNSVSDNKYNIPICLPIEFASTNIIVNPMLIGMLAGSTNGYDNNYIIKENISQDILDKMSELMVDVGLWKSNHGSYSFDGNGSEQAQYIEKNKLYNGIPNEYKYADVSARKALFEGLCLVTDNNLSKDIIIFDNIDNMNLANDICFIARSLGLRPTITYNIDNKIKIVIIQSLPLTIVNIKLTDSYEEMKCIAVDSDYHTYICKDFIVTHNTFMMAMLIAKFNVKPVMIFADKISLCQQIQNEISKFLGVDVGIVGDGQKDYKDITVVSLQSAETEEIQKAKLAMFDECLPAEAMVLTAEGNYVPIWRLVARFESGEHLSVMSYNIETKQLEEKEVTNAWSKPLDDHIMLNIKVSIGDKDFSIKCTENHKIWLINKQQYIKAEDIKPNDKVVVYYDKQLVKGVITQITSTYTSRFSSVYDITVADNHNFITGNVVVSNCHHIPADTAMSVANQCTNAYYRVGVSATPWRDAGDDMLIEAALSKKGNTVINASQLIKLGYLVPPKIFFVPITQKFKGKNYNAVYNQAIIDNDYRNRVIYRIVKKMLEKDRKILILIKNIRHGDMILEALRKQQGDKITNIKYINSKGNENTADIHNIEFLSGADNSDQRLAVFEGIKQGACNVMIASSVADEGLDLPILDTLILAGGGKSSTRAFQRVGRVLRLYKGKTKAFVFDFIDYTPMLRRHSRVRQKLYLSEPEWEIQKFNVDPNRDD